MTFGSPTYLYGLFLIPAAIVFLWGLALFQKQVKSTFQAVREYPRALGWAAFGAVAIPLSSGSSLSKEDFWLWVFGCGIPCGLGLLLSWIVDGFANKEA